MGSTFEESVEAEAIGSGDKLVEPSQALAIIVPTTLVRPAAASAMWVPKLIADAGEHASLRFLDFFTANIRNPNTRAAYAVAVRAFFAWLDAKHVAPLAAVRTHHVSAYVEFLGRRYRAPTVKQHLAAEPSASRLDFTNFVLQASISPANPRLRAAVRMPAMAASVRGMPSRALALSNSASRRPGG